MTDTRRYWAQEPAEEMPDLMLQKARDYWDFCDEVGRFDLWDRARSLYYGNDPEGTGATSSRVTFGGKEGETTELRVNHFRSLLEHVVALVTATRPTMTARAVNADAESMAQSRVADGLLDYYMTEQRLEDHAVNAVRHILRSGEGAVRIEWDPSMGEPHSVDPITGMVLHQGDVSVNCLHPRDVIRDPAHEGVQDHNWLIVHDRMSRWDLMSDYGDSEEAQEAIRNAPPVLNVSKGRTWTKWQEKSEDEISVLELYHAKTPSMPDGRYCLMAADVLLFDGPLPYERIPVLIAAPDEEQDTPMGYTTGWDLMSLQQALDDTVSTMLSNHSAFGKQHVWTQKGSGLDVEDLGEGLTHWESNSKPEALQLTAISEHAYKLADLLTQSMQTIAGINDVARGNPEGVTSGSMAALIHAMAAQYNNALQRAYGGLLEDMGTHLVQVLQRYATTPRLADISGIRGRPMLKEFTAEDIGKVRRVVVDMGNALMRTSAGRQHAAETLFNAKAISGQQFLDVIATGRLDPVTERADTRRRGLASENEMLIEGQTPRVLITDHHQQHIDEHLSLLDEPNIREDEKTSAVILDHIQSHIEVWQTVPPHMLAVFQIPPAPVPMPMAPPMPAPGGDAPMGGGNVDAGAPNSGVTEEPMPNPGSVEGVRMPAMPDSPMSGEQYDPNAGGM